MHSSPLAITDRVHTPGNVNIKNLDQLVPPLRIMITAYRSQQSGNVNVRTDDWVEDPFKAKISDAFQALLERVDPGDFDCTSWRKTFAREKPEKGRLTGTVGCIFLVYAIEERC